MKAPAFEFVRPSSVQEAAQILAQHDGDARVLAGGQSLVPMLNLRLARPSVVVDISALNDLNPRASACSTGLASPIAASAIAAPSAAASPMPIRRRTGCHACWRSMQR